MSTSVSADASGGPSKRQKTDAVESGQPQAQPLPYEADPDSYVDARTVVNLRFVAGADDLKADAVSFAPEFAHQIFNGESIAAPMRVRPFAFEVLYDAFSLRLFVRHTTPLPTSLEDALFTLINALPSERCASEAELLAAASHPTHDAHPLELFGEDISESSPPGQGRLSVHCGLLCDSAARADFCGRLQSVMRWYIESHSPIDTSEERWRLFSLVERCETQESHPRYRLVGAMTCFVFNRWLPATDDRPAGTRRILRVCQALVLPPYQGRGHGKRLLQAVYDWCTANDVVEVTVEDPSPKFRLLRDVVDVRLCLSKQLLRPESMEAAPTAEQLGEAQSALLLTREQLCRCFEVQQLRMLRAQTGSVGADSGEGEQLQKRFRLSVKRRLNKKHQEQLEAIADSTARKALLEELYQELMQEYAALLDRLQD